jgi:chromosome segregation protein
VKFTKLRLLGFKSFVEPTEFLIEHGLTGVVGPNGCGKSNLVEALRWVMGENSYKNMRASGMDDVIFSGSGNRPARNMAEVTLFLDNADRTAPAAFNDSEELQVSRRIEREAGSAYRINGREVRAKDVQLLFADASTGARSPSMVGQGRIGELISAKPQARRALLEEAAGISGLHNRRHEAELRLRAAEQNLGRLEDVVAEMESQLDNLKRQTRQANRYRNLSAAIRRAEALLLHLKWSAACAAEAEADSALSAATTEVGERAAAQAAAATAQAQSAASLPPLREQEAACAAALQRLSIARSQIEQEAERAAGRQRELERRQNDLSADLARETRMAEENRAAIARLDGETAELKDADADAAATLQAARERVALAAAVLSGVEAELDQANTALAGERARKAELERVERDAAERGRRLGEQVARLEAEIADLAQRIASLDVTREASGRVSLLEKRAIDAEKDSLAAERAAAVARAGEQELRPAAAAAEAEVNRLETEARTLARVLDRGGGLFAAIVDAVRVEPGYEAALGAALGDDLEAPADASAPAHWLNIAASADDPALPAGAIPLSSVVAAPAELARRLAQIGVVSREDGRAMMAGLKTGQRLVSRQGDLWRWDGFVSGAEAPTAAAQRLAQKNRLAELDEALLESRRRRADAVDAHEEARVAAAAAGINEQGLRDAWRAAQKSLAEARDELAAAQRAIGEFSSRRAARQGALDRLGVDLQDNRAALAAARAGLAQLPPLAALEADVEQRRVAVASARAAFAEASAAAEGLGREAQARARRLAAIAGELAEWRARGANAEGQMQSLQGRLAECRAEIDRIRDLPAEIEQRRARLADEIAAAEARRSNAADALAQAEGELAQADRLARDTLAELSQAREGRARTEERLAAARERRQEAETRIREEQGCEPAEALARAELPEGSPMREPGDIERELEQMKADRERLGPVNLRAEAEQAEIAERRNALTAERDDLIEAIRRLRQGIANLNREGRERLMEAFGEVNSQFQRLFTHLFGGGAAELQLIDSEDPLEAGLEILARPPGKKPQTMTLLSGGEQALTAMALIFAVFLTNPAPVCVLDEVDAPLDDHNVERFCNLMDEMAKSTETRFVIITHNPITMARMSRLFGVTMAERGVSQLVSVNLEEAERLREAG